MVIANGLVPVAILPKGVTEALAVEGELFPMPFVAVTVKV
jgi:hypothetical protein